MPPPSWACLPLCSHPPHLGCHRALAWVPCVIFFIISPTACCKGLTGELSVNFILSCYSQVQSSPVFTYYWQTTRLSNLGPTELKTSLHSLHKPIYCSNCSVNMEHSFLILSLLRVKSGIYCAYLWSCMGEGNG